MTDLLEIRYVPLSQCQLWDRNPKLHSIDDLVASIERYGFKESPRYEPHINGPSQGGIVAGNGRIEALAWMHQQGRQAPRGIQERDGEWFVPITFGVDAESQIVAEAYGLDANNLTAAGGNMTVFDMARMYTGEYTDILSSLATADALPITVDGDALDALLAGMANDALGVEFKEYDESVENDVKYCTCPSCGHKFPA